MESLSYTVLVIDDQPGIRRLLVEVLTEEGHLVVAASNGYEGLQKAKECQPQLILMDMKMPGMDGIETLRELKKAGLGDNEWKGTEDVLSGASVDDLEAQYMVEINGEKRIP
ncbi:MAG: response regulator, partial [Sporomusaceae bacterium]|nr:response regulator [Sporomusaceae bacterium]